MNCKNPYFFILLLLFGCQDVPEQRQKNDITYFDLRGYLEKEAARLSAASPVVSKTVSVNDSSETKHIKISDWSKELEIFRDADINKAAWKGMFKITKHQDTVEYMSNNENIPVKKLKLYYQKNSNKTILQGFQVIINNTNMLYNSTDTLLYYPDSLYQAKKSQDILLLSKKNYEVTGKF